MPDTQREYIGDIFSSGQHLLSLINDILDLSKVEAGMMTLELESANLSNLLSSSLSIVKEIAMTQRVRLKLEVDDNVGIFQLDVRKTKQIMYNLLSNAVKFSGQDGTVTLSARRVLRNEVGAIPGAWPGQSFPLPDNEFTDFVELAVRDVGIGISAEDMATLFQAFSQIDSSLARKFEGTGLGLAMVKQLAHIHGGTVAVGSAENEGSCFAVWLPIRPGEVTVSPIDESQIAPLSLTSSSGNVALVVEDDEHAAKILRLLLEAEGFVVVHAASAEEALIIGQRQPLSLISLDVMLPGIDGWDFLLRIRDIEAMANVPVVLIAGVEERNMSLTSGAAAVLQKPISRAQLGDALVRLGLQPTASLTRTVLVVDDDPKSVEVIATFLPSTDYTVVRAYSGAEAILLAQRLRPDLILLDLMMPEISGFQVVERLQRDMATAKIPVIVVTAKAITGLDKSTLSRSSMVVGIVEKSSLDHKEFVAGVRRAIQRMVAVT